ncbi:MAG: TadE/TadG family type IV pilus assembly protein [Thermoleophilaceae bacterium]
MFSIRRDGGQASVEMVGVLPAVILAAAVAWQLALAGHAAWACANAARVAARAQLVGEDARAAARSALPRHLEHGLRVQTPGGGDAGAVRVTVRVPLLLPGVRSPVSVGAAASLGEGS